MTNIDTVAIGQSARSVTLWGASGEWLLFRGHCNGLLRGVELSVPCDTAAQRQSGSGPQVDLISLWKCQPSGPLPTLVFVRPAHGDVMCAVHRRA